jgi:hypothetical protein
MLNNDDATYAVLWLNENHSNNSFDRELFRKRLDGCQIVILGFRPAPEPTRYKTFMWPEDPTDPELVKEFTWQRHAARVSSLRPFARQDPNIVIPDGNQRLWTARGQGRTS